MKLLILLPRVPYPLEKGDKLRAFHLIRNLSASNDITLVALNDANIHPQAISVLSAYCKDIHILQLRKTGIFFRLFFAFFTRTPFQIAYYYGRNAKKKLSQIIEQTKPDHVFCQLIRVSEYLKDVQIPKTLDYQDALSQGLLRRISTSGIFMKLLLKMEYPRVLRYESEIFSFFNHKTIISEPDKQLIEHPEREQICVIPNGVDLNYFSRMSSKKEYHLLFSGNMAYPPNVNCAMFIVQKILPLVWMQKPEVKFVIAGAEPVSEILKMQSNRIIITGWVEDLRDYYSKALIFIAPMQIGTGLQNKLLEAMAMGLPCVTSPLANNALKAKNGSDILVGNNPEEIVSHIIRLLDDQDFATTIAQNGHAFVKENYDWTSVTTGLMKLMEGK